MNKTIVTVLGKRNPESIGVTDGHSHVWIEPIDGGPQDAPRLADEPAIADELQAFYRAGGGAIVDCQPGECGRNGNVLRRLSLNSNVHIIACTGFHRRRYYTPDAWLWQGDGDGAADYFIDEIENGLTETRRAPHLVYPGFIKIAAEATFDQTPRFLFEAATTAVKESGMALEMHTEKGSAVEECLDFFIDAGVSPKRLIFCHVDKRPDFGLHRELATAGVMLEYDTFYREKYDPEKNLWPLIMQMVDGGFDNQIALATDMADSTMWQTFGGFPGKAAFPQDIKNRLRQLEFPHQTIDRLMGGNIIGRLACR